MAGEANATTALATLKTLWPEDALEDSTLAASPAFGMLQKSDEFEGDGTINLTVEYALQQGVAGNLGDAISNATANGYKKYVLPLATVYAFGKVGGMLIRQSRSNKGSLVRALNAEQKGLNKQISKIASALAWGNGGGALARIDGASNVGTATVTLADKNSARWFTKGMVCQLAATDGTSGAVKAGTLTVASVDRRLGKVTFTGNVTAGVATAVNTDWIFLRGLFGTGGEYPVPLGFEAWNPSTDPQVGENFLGVDRSEAPEELAGLRFLDPQANLEETIGAAYAYADNEGEFPETLLMSPVRVHELGLSIKERERNVSEIVRGAQGGKGREVSFGYSGIKYVTSRGVVEVFADPACPVNGARAITEEDWKVYHLGALPQILTEDGLQLERLSNADVYGWRLLMAYNQACLRPKGQMYIKLALALLAEGNSTMGAHVHPPLLGYDRGVALIAGGFFPNGEDDIDNDLNIGKGFSVVRDSEGVYVVTFRQRYARVLNIRPTLWRATNEVLGIEASHFFRPIAQGVNADGNSYVAFEHYRHGKARLTGSVNITGGVAAGLDAKTLIVTEGSGQQTVLFATPANYTDVISQVNTQTGLLVASDGGLVSNHYLRLTSDTRGEESVLQIVGGTGASDLGLPIGSIARGLPTLTDIEAGDDTIVAFEATVYTRSTP